MCHVSCVMCAVCCVLCHAFVLCCADVMCAPSLVRSFSPHAYLLYLHTRLEPLLERIAIDERNVPIPVIDIISEVCMTSHAHAHACTRVCHVITWRVHTDLQALTACMIHGLACIHVMQQ